MLANRNNVVMGEDNLARKAVRHGYALAEALEDAAYDVTEEDKDVAEPEPAADE